MSALSDREHAALLEAKFLDGEHLSEIAAYFFTHLGNRMDFMTAGVVKGNTVLESRLTSALTHYTGKPCNIASPNFMYVAELYLFHGPISTPLGYASVFFMERVDMGIMAIAQEDGHVKHLLLGSQAITAD